MNLGDYEPALRTEVESWIFDAGNPYWIWLWGSVPVARSRSLEWSARSNSELSLDSCRIVRSGGLAIGAYLAYPGSELNRRRRADTLALLQVARKEEGGELLNRLKSASSTFPLVADDEFHLSRLAVAPLVRGRGFGKEILNHFLASGRNEGFNRFSLNVAISNSAAIRLYVSAGFVFTGSDVVSHAEVPYRCMRLSCHPGPTSL